MRTPEERRQIHWIMLLRYTVMQCGARAGALFRHDGGALVPLARTDGWPPDSEPALESLWRAGSELTTDPVRRAGELVLWPLFDHAREVVAVIALTGLAEPYAPSARERDLFERLRVEATAPLPRDPLRALLAALAAFTPRWTAAHAGAA